MNTNINPLLLCDFYKVGHKFQYPEGTTLVYSNFTPRKSRIKGIDEVVFFGLQGFIKDYLIDAFNNNFFKIPKQQALNSYKEFVESGLGKDAIDYSHIAALHDLQYLPIAIKALPEGSKVPIRVPVLTVFNTHPDFFWLPNFLETVLSTQLWQATTSATIAYQYRKILDKYAEETSTIPEFVDWQGHDFSMRGMSSVESAQLSGAGHLLSFSGTDTIPALYWLNKNYNAPTSGLIGGSVAATEHSVMCAGEKDDELGTFKRLITEVYPKGIVSIVSDTWNLWKVLTEYLPALKDIIEKRDGKVVIRPDSGDPVDIICGTNTDSKYQDLSQWWKGEGSPIDDPEYFWDCLREDSQEDVAHGEQGPEEYTGYYKINGKFYEATVTNLNYNRYDKQYYFLEMWEEPKITVKELEQTPAMKGVIENLYEVFGGTKNAKGYIELPGYIGAIYGDSITPDRATQICERLKAKGFASTNIVFGIGSYTYQYNTRDTFGFAMKATYVEVEGWEWNNTVHNTGWESISPSNMDAIIAHGLKPEPEFRKVTGCREIFKDPITDDGTKKSARGLLSVFSDENGKYFLNDQAPKEAELSGDLQLIFQDSTLFIDEDLDTIRKRLKG